jgi:hypothetical protein
MVTFAPDDPQGEFGSLPQNDACPYLSSVDLSPSDDQGQDGMKGNGTCPMWNGTRPSFDDDQGSDKPKTCKAKNGTVTHGSSGGSCPISMATLNQGPDGAEDGSESCSTSNDTMVLELGFLNQSCPFGTNMTMEVDAEQGEDGNAEQSCPAIPEGVIITPLADQGTYESTNASCLLLDPKFPISPMDEQSDDWDPQLNAGLAPNITTEEIPDDPPEKSYSELTNPCAPPTSSGLGKCSTVLPKKFPAQATGILDLNRLVSCACESQTKGQTIEISNVCGAPMCPNSVRTLTGIADPKKPPITTDSWMHSEQPSIKPPEHSYPPITCNCDVPKMPELGACSRQVNPGTPRPGGNAMNWGAPIPVTFCSCESGTHGGTTVCDQFVCPNDPNLEIPTPCPQSACALPTNKKLGKCSSTTAVLSTGGGPLRTFSYCECKHQGVAPVPMLTGCDGSHVCPNQADLVTDYSAYNGVSDYSCTLGLPSLSFWDSCVYTRDLPFGWEIKEEANIRHSCLCNVADNKGATNTYAPVTVNCGNYLCHNSAPIRLRRAVSDEQMEASAVLPPPSVVTAAMPLVSITAEATPGSLPTANPGPTSTHSAG